jgi:ABC-2 type transport system permease protein
MWNGLRSLLRNHRTRLFLIVFLTVLIWASLFGLFFEGFRYLSTFDRNGPVSYKVTELLFGLFFLSVTMLTIFSSGLLLYGNLFRNPEAWFLLSTPARADQIFAYKFQEALLFSGWSFLLLGLPLLLGYGITMGASWVYYALFPFYLLGFLLMPGAIGSMVCLLIVTYFAKHRRLVLAVLLVVFGALILLWIGSVAQGAQLDRVSDAWLRKLIDHLRPTRNSPPASWMTDGLLSAAQVKGTPVDWWRWYWAGDSEVQPLIDAIYNLLLVWSYGLIFYLAAAYMARRLYRRAFDQVAGGGGRRRKHRASWSDRLLETVLAWTKLHTRTFVLKDWRSFRRDPAQWGQVLLLGSIILLYFVNIPNLPHGQYALHQRTLIGLLNVAVIALMQATYTSRFVFPLMSMEGRNFWILSLLPLQRDQLLRSKFTYAATFTVSTSLILVVLSEVMLRLPWPVMLLHTFTMLVLALGLAALGVGMGAYLVNLKETNPSKIATGFGGTINLLLSLAFSVFGVAIAAVPTLYYFKDSWNPAATPPETVELESIGTWLICSALALALLGIAVVEIPLRMGRYAFRKMEF